MVKEKRIQWIDAKADEYFVQWKDIWGWRIGNMDRDITKAGAKEDLNEIETRWKKLIGTIKEAAMNAKMEVKNRKGKKQRAEWDDGSYEALRKENFKFLNQYRKKSDLNNKDKYLVSSKNLKAYKKKL